MIKEKLEQAIKDKKNDLNNYIWKGEKKIIDGNVIQKEKRLVDCSLVELQMMYEYCKEMLNNDSKETPGRYNLIKIIQKQRECCNAELFVRYLVNETGMSKMGFITSIRSMLSNSPGVEASDLVLQNITNDCLDQFKDLRVDLLLDALMGKLGKFSKKHLTLTFILKQGLWITDDEWTDLKKSMKIQNIDVKDKNKFIKESLKVPQEHELKINPKGFTFTEMQALMRLRSAKYSELSTLQLTLLRDKVLFLLEDEVLRHIKAWEMRKKQIQEVCAYKNYDLCL